MIAGLDTITAKILAIVAVLGLGFAAVQTVRLSSAQVDLEDKRNELATCEARHAVTRQSISTLEATIEQLNERALSRAEAYAAAQTEAAKRSAELAKLSRESDQRINRLRKLAREQVNGDCPVPDELRELAKGL
jgi:septal ring factor EnvC (AmiA/AmiB activator)